MMQPNAATAGQLKDLAWAGRDVAAAGLRPRSVTGCRSPIGVFCARMAKAHKSLCGARQ
jgi:hypothetical protein